MSLTRYTGLILFLMIYLHSRKHAIPYLSSNAIPTYLSCITLDTMPISLRVVLAIRPCYTLAVFLFTLLQKHKACINHIFWDE
jgi:hypothetical protein